MILLFSFQAKFILVNFEELLLKGYKVISWLTSLFCLSFSVYLKYLEIAVTLITIHQTSEDKRNKLT